MKYIRYEKIGIITFGNHIKHSDMNKMITSYQPDKVISAGFVANEGDAICFGESDSLDIKSMGVDDSSLLNQGPNYFDN